jgi:hypothetical protein
LRVAGAVLLAVSIASCGGGSKHTTACKLFEDGYNKVTDSVRSKLSYETIMAEHDMLPYRIPDAEEKTEGDVAVALRDARELAPGLGSGNQDAGVAFFMSADTVGQKCKADGAAIDLHAMSSPTMVCASS